jgi:hypothetical protein
LVVRALAAAGLPLHIHIEPRGRVDFDLLKRGIKSLWELNVKASADGYESTLAPEQMHSGELSWPWFEAELDVAKQFYDEVITSGNEMNWKTIAGLELLVGDDWPPCMVNPRQLEKSPELEWIGTVCGDSPKTHPGEPASPARQ